MFTYYHQQRVRYSETDQMGYVYYANYGFYYEQARAEAVRFLGIAYKDIEASGIITPVTRMNIKYIQPAFYDELLTIKTIISEMPNRMMTIHYEIYNEKNQLINKADTSMIFADAITKQMKTAPACLIEKLEPYFEKSGNDKHEEFHQVLAEALRASDKHHISSYRKTG